MAKFETSQVWDWFGDHGCFIGGMPMTDTYTANLIINPLTTPFDRLYINPEKRKVALRLRKGAIKDGRLFDEMEIIMRRSNMNMPDTGLVIYQCKDPEDVPEPHKEVEERTIFKQEGDWIRFV